MMVKRPEPRTGLGPPVGRSGQLLSTVGQAVARKLRRNWSPEQIAGWLKRAYPDDESYHVSHETIYRSLFVQARGVLKKEPWASSVQADDSSIQKGEPERHWTGKDRGYGIDP